MSGKILYADRAEITINRIPIKDFIDVGYSAQIRSDAVKETDLVNFRVEVIRRRIEKAFRRALLARYLYDDPTPQERILRVCGHAVRLGWLAFDGRRM